MKKKEDKKEDEELQTTFSHVGADQFEKFFIVFRVENNKKFHREFIKKLSSTLYHVSQGEKSFTPPLKASSCYQPNKYRYDLVGCMARSHPLIYKIFAERFKATFIYLYRYLFTYFIYQEDVLKNREKKERRDQTYAIKEMRKSKQKQQQRKHESGASSVTKICARDYPRSSLTACKLRMKRSERPDGRGISVRINMLFTFLRK